MSGAFNLPSHKRRPSINITPLIDVMFLLLIFFMVSSTFKDDYGIEIELPEAESAESHQEASHEIVVDSEGAYYFGGEAVDEEGLREVLKLFIESEPGATLSLRADRNADFGFVLRVIDIAEAVGGTKLVIPTDLLEVLPPEQ